MLQMQHIRNQTEEVLAGLKKRGNHFEALVQQAVELDDARKKAQSSFDALQAELNAISREIGQLFRDNKQQEANEKKEITTSLKIRIKEEEEAMNRAESDLQQVLYQIPNVPYASVPNGKSAEDNEIVFKWGEVPKLEVKEAHWDLAAKYDLIDFELGVKITGAGFPVYKGKGARLQRALINFFLDQAREAGYAEIQPPIFINEASGYGTGQLPDKEGQMYHMSVDNLFAIPTAEVPITNLYRDVILNPEELPIKNVGYTPCFRREAGSYGKDVRGLNRLHQFDKVEIVQIAHPEHSYQILETMSAYVQSLLQKLGLHYRVLRLCGGDMGFTSALTYDMEVYSAAQERWLEVSSVSNFESYQSNRLKLRIRNTSGKNELAHTLNGSALALPRIVAALLENNQTAEGINLPAVLHPYLGFERI